MIPNALPYLNLQATGFNIKNLRKKNGYTVRDLQNIFRFNEPQSIYKWQRGECLPTVENLLVLSRLFNISIEGILVYDEVPFHLIEILLIYH
ncbi:helix-turn-helix transcriptional regulator [Clostridium sp. 19966]|uniref:helix-turn-helix transcriptional regulator n=1 Tax=Clostridium sp. 19966 TaxID=2768166 RepID=UPI0028DE6CDA|nr:helix-turn-helix transcriptional regulator [Clostridium sp. 19966]MDT8719381.1 helix-turn-helix transcriptional regulator [Clostridium sp. 19966]